RGPRLQPGDREGAPPPGPPGPGRAPGRPGRPTNRRPRKGGPTVNRDHLLDDLDRRAAAAADDLKAHAAARPRPAFDPDPGRAIPVAPGGDRRGADRRPLFLAAAAILLVVGGFAWQAARPDGGSDPATPVETGGDPDVRLTPLVTDQLPAPLLPGGFADAPS